ncbi:extracellular solute-binding protein [Vibrio profundum]|uniref:extracellular solute-binding protein n=1 Tax=Vibrio profundum TaxID=2910247 RepID=UPI003D0E87D1
MASVSAGIHAEIIETTRLAGFGQPKYPENFQHFEYVNAKAPKYGQVTFGQIGTYDNFNRYASRGVSAAATGELYDALMFGPSDEIDSHYPLIAEKVRYSDDFMWMEVDLNANAKFHDGKPITAHDVAFTFDKFMTEGVPQFRVYYKDIKSVKALNERTVRVEMAHANREKLFSFVQSIPILPQHFWQDKNFSQPLDTPPVGSSAYKIIDYKPGQSVTYALADDYWAKELPVNIGRNNFQQIRYDYYRDETVLLEAFKAGEFDIRQESSAKFWASSYTGSNFDRGYIVKEEIPHQKPVATQGFVFNTQRPVFRDPKVREALNYAFDFEWMNKNMFYNSYLRTRSYFENSAYEANGLPSQGELDILLPNKSNIPERVFTQSYQPPQTDGSGRIRSQMRTAFKLLKDAGWVLKDGVMMNAQSEPFEFELLVYSPTTERYAIPLQKNLKRLGVHMKIRTIDTTQYTKRLRDRDFDMVSSSYPAMNYPSPDLMIVWNSEYIDSTYNKAGVMDPVVDELTLAIARNQQDPNKLKMLGRALDRVLQWGFYMIPQWYINNYRVASWDKFERPKVMPIYDLGLDTWWVSKQKASKLPEQRQ